MVNTGIKIDKALLIEKYVKDGKSIAVVAKELNISTDTVYKRLKLYGLNRNKSDAQKLKCNKIGVHNSFNLDVKILKKLYLEYNLTPNEIAKKLGCSKSKVSSTLKNIGILKNLSEIAKNRKFSDITRRKLRLKHIERIEIAYFNGHQITPIYNKKSIGIIDKYGLENGFHFQHAENGGEFSIKELGYWVDGYDKNKNVVIEFDEKYHNKQIEKDNKRQNEIIEYLKCDFIRINENGEEKLNLKFNGKHRN